MSAPGLRRLLPVRVQEQRLLIDAAQVVGIEDGARVQRNPSAGPPYGWLLGSTDGPTVFDLATLLDLEVSHRAVGSVVVLSRASGELWGLLVDQAESSVHVAADEIFPLTHTAGFMPYAAIAQTPGTSTLVLAVEDLHPDDAESKKNFEGPGQQLRPLANPVAAKSSPQQMLWVSVDLERGVHVGFSSQQIVEICDLLPIAPIPGAGLPLLGFAGYDGQGLPVADLNALLEVTAKPSSRGRLLIARATRSARRVGLPIFGEVRLVELPIAHRPGVIPPEMASWIRGSFLIDEGTLMVPDLDVLLDSGTSLSMEG